MANLARATISRHRAERSPDLPAPRYWVKLYAAADRAATSNVESALDFALRRLIAARDREERLAAWRSMLQAIRSRAPIEVCGLEQARLERARAESWRRAVCVPAVAPDRITEDAS